MKTTFDERLRLSITSLVALLLAACGGGGGGSNGAPGGGGGGGGGSSSFTVGGTVAGLSGSGLVLQVNGGNSLAVTGSGNFTFASPLASGSSYTVSVSAQPTNPAQSCVLSNATGTIGSSNVTNVSVTCTTVVSFTVGGTVAGLSVDAGLVLRNGGEELAVARNGSFVFASSVATGAGYSVTVSTQPTSPVQACTVTNGAGTIGSAAVTNVSVSCDGIALLAGSVGGAGFIDAVGTGARFNRPYDVVFDAAGNLFVADANNNSIRRITPAGAVSLFAGMPGMFGSTDGAVSAARFYSPRGLAMDGAGNIYVADYDNHTIRRITPAGVVSTLAGIAGVPGSQNGTGGAARFFHPSDVACDVSGNVYVADDDNHTIRKVTPAGVVTTLAGQAGASGTTDATGNAARFDNPRGLTVDASGNVYVADSDNHTLRKITAAGVVTTLAGSPGLSGVADGTGSAARFRRPSRVTLNSAGNLVVGDTGNHTIRVVTPAGVVTTLAGVGRSSGSDDGIGAAARFDEPAGIAFGAAGDAFVADSDNQTIRRVTSAGVVTTFAGGPIRIGSVDGAGASARFGETAGIDIDSEGNAFVVDFDHHTIRKVTPEGVVSTFAGLANSPGAVDGVGSEARFLNPIGVALDAAGNVYVTEFNSTVRKITPAGVVTTLAGVAGQPGSADGTGSAARFELPYGIATDVSGNVYVADQNHTIRKITPAGVVTTLAGVAGDSGSADGSGAAARFLEPTDVEVDPAGNVYVADNSNHTIRRITPAGVVTTIAGTAGVVGRADGIGGAAEFNSPFGIALDPDGNVYIADAGNNSIRRLAPDGTVTTVAGTPPTLGVRLGPLPGGLAGPTFLAVLPGSPTRLIETDVENGILLITLP